MGLGKGVWKAGAGNAGAAVAEGAGNEFDCAAGKPPVGGGKAEVPGKAGAAAGLKKNPVAEAG